MTADDAALEATGLSDAPTWDGPLEDTPSTPPPVVGGPAPGRVLHGRYVLEEIIDHGGAAVVWRAHDDLLSRTVAIKLLHAHLADDPTTVERFRRESLGAARVLHPNVVTIYDSGQDEGLAFLVLEFVDGPTLKTVIEAKGALPTQAVAALGEQVAAALGEAHRQGLVHRDVKPANILIGSDGQVKVADFGIAKALSQADTALTGEGMVIGTAAYVAPEQLTSGDQATPRSDVYALGLVLHEALTGHAAFGGTSPVRVAEERLRSDPTPPRQLRADVPRLLEDIVVRATARDPAARYEDGSAMSAALAALVRERPADLTARLVRDLDRTPRAATPAQITSVLGDLRPGAAGSGIKPWHWLAVAAAVIVLGAVAVVAPNALDDPPTDDPIDVTGVIPIVAARDYDPYGQPPEEHRDEVPFAHDGDASTAWSTETYRGSASFADLKPGAGLWFDLGESTGVQQIDVDLAQGGIAVEIYAADELPDEVTRLPGWGPPVVRFAELPESASLRLTAPVRGRYWLLWITTLADTGTGYRAGVEEIVFRAS